VGRIEEMNLLVPHVFQRGKARVLIPSSPFAKLRYRNSGKVWRGSSVVSTFSE